MRILHINDNDLAGSRFNGHELQIALNRMGHPSHQFVCGKASNDYNTIALFTHEDSMLREYCRFFEESLSIHALVYPFGQRIMQHELFQKADIVHLHLIHNHFISLYDLLEMSRRKPIVWTMHDPWAMTAHCVHPIECKKWKIKCENCPNPERYFPLSKNTSKLLWDVKKTVYANLEVDVIIASDWMRHIVESSPLTCHFKSIHNIPFGICSDLFTNIRNKSKLRNKYNIPEENFTIFFRSDDSPYKGFHRIKRMLMQLKTNKNITLVAVAGKKNLKEFAHIYQVIEFGWTNDENMMAELYTISDIFLMPSIAEAFGLMAIEAMASGLPVIVYEGTALPDVVFAPECGFAVKNEKQFREVILMLINNPIELELRGKLARKMALKHYRFEDYVTKHVELYNKILERKRIFNS